MARRTFNKAGKLVDVLDGEAGQTIRIVEAKPESDGEFGGNDSGNETGEGVSFEPVGSVIRTEPISNASDSGTDTRTEYIDPSTATGPKLNKDGTPRKRRGEGKQTSGESSRVVTANLEKVLFSLHVMAAATLKEPDLAIDEDEAKILAEALEKIANAYNFSTIFSPKTQAGIDLTIALVTVYGARVMKIAQKQRRPMRNVTPINQTGTETK